MPQNLVTTDQIFQALFNAVKGISIVDWDGNAVALNYATRNWTKEAETADSVYPALFQMDPLRERITRTGRGRSRVLKHASVEVRFQRGPQEMYPENKPFGTMLNNWRDAIYQAISPSDFPNLGLPQTVSDVYPIEVNYDYGLDTGRIAIVESVIEIVVGE